jgi:hypothetical protein
MYNQGMVKMFSSLSPGPCLLMLGKLSTTERHFQP